VSKQSLLRDPNRRRESRVQRLLTRLLRILRRSDFELETGRFRPIERPFWPFWTIFYGVFALIQILRHALTCAALWSWPLSLDAHRPSRQAVRLQLGVQHAHVDPQELRRGVMVPLRALQRSTEHLALQLGQHLR
jgi:hypothetical protein